MTFTIVSKRIARHTDRCTCGQIIRAGDVMGYSRSWQPPVRCNACLLAEVTARQYEVREGGRVFVERV